MFLVLCMFSCFFIFHFFFICPFFFIFSCFSHFMHFPIFHFVCRYAPFVPWCGWSCSVARVTFFVQKGSKNENHFYQGGEHKGRNGSGPSPVPPRNEPLEHQKLTQQTPVPAVYRSGQNKTGNVVSTRIFVRNPFDAELIFSFGHLFPERVGCAMSAFGPFDALVLLELRCQLGIKFLVPSSLWLVPCLAAQPAIPRSTLFRVGLMN